MCNDLSQWVLQTILQWRKQMHAKMLCYIRSEFDRKLLNLLSFPILCWPHNPTLPAEMSRSILDAAFNRHSNQQNLCNYLRSSTMGESNLQNMRKNSKELSNRLLRWQLNQKVCYELQYSFGPSWIKHNPALSNILHDWICTLEFGNLCQYLPLKSINVQLYIRGDKSLC